MNNYPNGNNQTPQVVNTPVTPAPTQIPTATQPVVYSQPPVYVQVPVQQPVETPKSAPMSERKKKFFENTSSISSWILLALSILYGAMFSNTLISNDSSGVGLTLLVVAFYCFFTPFIVTGGGKTRMSAWLLLIPILVIALSPTLYASVYAGGLAVFAVLILMPLQLMLMGGCTKNRALSLWSFIDIFKVFFGYTFANIGNAFRSLGSNEGKKKGGAVKIIIGLLISIPVLIVLIALFAKADAAFAHFVRTIVDFIDFNFGDLVFDVIFGSILAVFIFSGVLTLRSGYSPEEKEVKTPHFLDSTIISTIVFAASAVYLVFVFFQIEYLFIGAKLPAGLTYAEYAYRGISELSWTIALTFIVCAAFRAFAKRNEAGKVPVILRAALTLVTLASFVVSASAFYRIFLYIDAYGLTEKRIDGVALIGFITLSMVALVISLWIDKIKLAPFVAAIAIVWISILSMLPSDRIIAKVNVDRYLNNGKEIDIEYMVDELSCGTMPEIERLYKNAQDEEIKLAAKGMMAMYYYEGSIGWGNYTNNIKDLDFGDWTVDHQLAYEIYKANGSPDRNTLKLFDAWYESNYGSSSYMYW